MKNAKKIISSVLAAIILTGSVVVVSGVKADAKSETGIVSWYSSKTSNGAAHKTIKKGTKVKVKNLRNGKTTTVVINDRGPYVDGRILDMSKTSFSKAENTSAGLFKGTITW